MVKKVIGLGAGGHAKVIIDALYLNDAYKIFGFLDPHPKSQTFSNIPVLGDDSYIPEVINQGVSHFFVGIGGINDNTPRKKLFELGLKYGMTPINVIHAQAIISSSVRMGDGNIIMSGSVINADSLLGSNVIINTGTIIEHDCIIGDHVHIATGSKLAGDVQVDKGAHISIGATIIQGVCIGENAIVGSGAVVIRDVYPNTTVVGCPAKKI